MLPPELLCSSNFYNRKGSPWLGGEDPVDLEHYLADKYSSRVVGRDFLATTYAATNNNVPRSAQKGIPPMPSGFHFPNQDVENAYRKIWAGDFYVKIEDVDMQFMGMNKRGVMLLVSVLSDDSDNDDDHDGKDNDEGYKYPLFAQFSTNFTVLSFQQDNFMLQWITNDLANGMCSDTPAFQAFQTYTSESMKQVLYRQILHHMFRQHGHRFELPDAELWTDHLIWSYRRESDKAYAYGLDVAVARLDSALARFTTGKEEHNNNNNIQNEVLSSCFIPLAPLLQACGKFAVSGQVEEATAEGFLLNNDKQEGVLMYMNAAHSFKVAEVFAETERLFVKVRQIQGGGGLNIDESNQLLLDAYSQWHGQLLQEQGSEMASHKEATEICLTYHTYIALLAVHKYKCQDEVAPVAKFISKMLQQKYQKQSASRKVIKEILQSSTSGRDFRTKILACLKPTITTSDYTYARLQKEHVALRSFDQNSGGVVGKKRHARAFLDKEQLNICRPCRKGELVQLSKGQTAKFLFCPCRCDGYCSKACQVADWPTHKQFCAHFQTKRQEKEKKKKQAAKKRQEK